MAFSKAQLRVIGGLIGNVRSSCCVVPSGHITYSGPVETKVIDELEKNGLVKRETSFLETVGTATAGWKTFGYVLLSDEELELAIAALHCGGSDATAKLADKLKNELDGRKKA